MYEDVHSSLELSEDERAGRIRRNRDKADKKETFQDMWTDQTQSQAHWSLCSTSICFFLCTAMFAKKHPNFDELQKVFGESYGSDPVVRTDQSLPSSSTFNILGLTGGNTDADDMDSNEEEDEGDDDMEDIRGAVSSSLPAGSTLPASRTKKAKAKANKPVRSRKSQQHKGVANLDSLTARSKEESSLESFLKLQGDREARRAIREERQDQRDERRVALEEAQAKQSQTHVAVTISQQIAAYNELVALGVPKKVAAAKCDLNELLGDVE